MGRISLSLTVLCVIALSAGSQPPSRPTASGSNLPASPIPKAPSSRPGPRLVAMAETKLLMEGMTQANFLGLEKILRGKAIDDESWGFARGQALLIAEAGNLLMIRPPKNEGQDAWMKMAGEMRESAGQLAKSVVSRDVERSRADLTVLSNACNACHQTFQVKTHVKAFGAEKP